MPLPPYRLIALECLRLLTNALRAKPCIPKFVQAKVEHGVAPCYALTDPKTGVSLALHQALREQGWYLAISVKPVAGRVLSVDLWELYHEPTGKTIDEIGQQFLAPQMAYLAELLVPATMPADAPDYVYMGV